MGDITARLLLVLLGCSILWTLPFALLMYRVGFFSDEG